MAGLAPAIYQIGPMELRTEFPLCIHQERRLAYEEWARINDVRGAPFHLTLTLRLQGPVEADILKAAVQAFVRRHKSLRVRIAPSTNGSERVEDIEQFGAFGAVRPGLFKQSIVENPAAPFVVKKLSSDEGDIASLNRVIVDQIREPFRYDSPPLLRSVLFQIAPYDYIFVVVLHHLVSDGWSLGLLRRYVEEFYTASLAGKSVETAPLSYGFPDFAIRQGCQLASPDARKAVDYWLGQWRIFNRKQIEYEDFPFVLPKPTMPTYCVGIERIALDEDTSLEVRSCARTFNVTLYTFFYVAFCNLLRTTISKTTFGVWTNFHNRTQSDVIDAVGWFANSHSLAVTLEDEPSNIECIRRARKALLDASAYQYMPLAYAWHVRGYSLERTGMRVIFEFVREYDSMLGNNITASPFALPVGLREVHLTFAVIERARNIELRAYYSQDRFAPTAIQHLLDKFQGALFELMDSSLVSI